MGMQKFRAPALPLPGQQYDQQQMTQFLRALQLYFNQLDSLTPIQVDSITADNFYGGLFYGLGYNLTFPHIAASDSTDQYADGDNTPTVVNWNTLESGYGWTLNAPGSATAGFSGIYKITYSLQFVNTANAVHYATVWLKVNNTDVPNSATIFAIPARKSATPGEEGYVCGYSEVVFTINAGDEFELYWATDEAYVVSPSNDGVYIFHDVAQSSPYARPAIPSAIGSIVFLSTLPEPSFEGVSAGCLVGSVEVRVG